MLEQFYKQDENTTLFRLYEILCQNSSTSQSGLTYAEIAHAFNHTKTAFSRKRTHKAQDKINSQDAAHYCKKLQKCGFVSITSQKEDSQKRITLFASN